MSSPVPRLTPLLPSAVLQADAEKRLAAGQPPLTLEELQRASDFYLEHLLYAAIAGLKVEDSTLILTACAAHLHLNSRRMVREDDLRVTFLSFAALQTCKDANATARKLAIVHALLNAGCTNVDEGYYLGGVNCNTAFQSAVDARLWPGISHAAHRGLVQRIMAVGGKPNLRAYHPLNPTPRQVAEKQAPYLLDLLPINQENDGQLALFAARENMPRQDSPALSRRFNVVSFLQR